MSVVIGRPSRAGSLARQPFLDQIVTGLPGIYFAIEHAGVLFLLEANQVDPSVEITYLGCIAVAERLRTKPSTLRLNSEPPQRLSHNNGIFPTIHKPSPFSLLDLTGPTHQLRSSIINAAFTNRYRFRPRSSRRRCRRSYGQRIQFWSNRGWQLHPSRQFHFSCS